MAEERRIEKVNILIRDTLADILGRELEFPEGIIVTLTRVVCSPDLYYASAYASVFPKKEKEVLSLLIRKTPHIQALLNKKLRMRPVPRIAFKIDEEEKKRERIEKLLSKP